MRWPLALLLAAACTQTTSHSEPQVASRVEVFDWPGLPPSKLDLLIVLDDTAEMAPYVDRTHALLDTVGHLWDSSGYATPDLHIAVTTADPADHGALRGGGVLVDEHLPDDSRFRNYDGTLADALTARGTVGTAGTSSQPLATVAPALDANADFLRANAALAILVVTAHDDASTAAPADVASALKQRKADPANVMILAVTPDTAPRLDTFLAQFPNRTSRASIDAMTYAPGVELLTQVLRTPLGARCLDEPLDVDPATPGPQLDCSVELVHEDGVSEIVPPCPGFAEPATLPTDGSHCWWYRRDPACTQTASGPLDVTPYHYWFEPEVRGQCLTAADPR